MSSLFGQSVTLASASIAATATTLAALKSQGGSSVSPPWALPWVGQSLEVLSGFWLAAVVVAASSMLSQTWSASGIQPRDIYDESLLTAPANSLRLALCRALQDGIDRNSARTCRYVHRLAWVVGLLCNRTSGHCGSSAMPYETDLDTLCCRRDGLDCQPMVSVVPLPARNSVIGSGYHYRGRTGASTKACSAHWPQSTPQKGRPRNTSSRNWQGSSGGSVGCGWRRRRCIGKSSVTTRPAIRPRSTWSAQPCCRSQVAPTERPISRKRWLPPPR